MTFEVFLDGTRRDNIKLPDLDAPLCTKNDPGFCNFNISNAISPINPVWNQLAFLKSSGSASHLTGIRSATDCLHEFPNLSS